MNNTMISNIREGFLQFLILLLLTWLVTSPRNGSQVSINGDRLWTWFCLIGSRNHQIHLPMVNMRINSIILHHLYRKRYYLSFKCQLSILEKYFSQTWSPFSFKHIHIHRPNYTGKLWHVTPNIKKKHKIS